MPVQTPEAQIPALTLAVATLEETLSSEKAMHLTGSNPALRTFIS